MMVVICLFVITTRGTSMATTAAAPRTTKPATTTTKKAETKNKQSTAITTAKAKTTSKKTTIVKSSTKMTSHNCPAAQVDKCSSQNPAKCPHACLDVDGKARTDLGCLKACLQWHKCFGNFQAEGCVENALACQPLLQVEIGDQRKIDAAKAACVPGQYRSDACLLACLPGIQCIFDAVSGLGMATSPFCPEWGKACLASLPELEPCVACEAGAKVDFPCVTACVPYIHCVGKGCSNKKALACDVLKTHPVSTDGKKVVKAKKACSKDASSPACVRECMPGIRCVIDHFAGAKATTGCATWVSACKATFAPPTTTTTLPTTIASTTTIITSHSMVMSSAITFSVFPSMFLTGIMMMTY